LVVARRQKKKERVDGKESEGKKNRGRRNRSQKKKGRGTRGGGLRKKKKVWEEGAERSGGGRNRHLALKKNTKTTREQQKPRDIVEEKCQKKTLGIKRVSI